MLDQVSKLVNSIPGDRISDLLDETFKAFNGAGPDFQSLLDSASKITRTSTASGSDAVADRRQWPTAGFAGRDRRLDPDVGAQPGRRSPSSSRRTTREFRAILQKGPGFAEEVSALLDQMKPTLPILLANLTTIGQILRHLQPVARTASGDLPRHHRRAAVIRSAQEQPDGSAVGRLRAHHQRSAAVHGRLPAAVAVALPGRRGRSIDTPDGLYCKLPQDSPIAVRGARNYPCMGHPGQAGADRRTLQRPEGLSSRWRCVSTRSGAYPFDPNLIAQGVPPDDRVDFNERIYAPVEGTPLPPALRRRRIRLTRPRRVRRHRRLRPRRPRRRPLRRPSGRRRRRATRSTGRRFRAHRRRPAAPRRPCRPRRALPAAAPSAFSGNAFRAVRRWRSAQYNPQTGEYLAPDGQMQQAGESGCRSGARSRGRISCRSDARTAVYDG